MRRLPVYFLVDVSESMVGAPIQQVQDGMRMIVQELRTDPYALETAYISVIAFAGKAKCVSPLTELYKFYPPTFPIGGGTSLGNALEFLMEDMDKTLVRTTTEQKGDWKPIVFSFSITSALASSSSFALTTTANSYLLMSCTSLWSFGSRIRREQG